ncbi:ATP-dependent helicase [Pseudomonas benzenivorans]|uniref:ATP-dependent helicase n=1 Tax=Pseudomonas benzenivorans TaxID=556533 RepID=A0ABZ0PQB0_9PSED|nr:ATP-dependent helicase [Pseudomonas benzenivorans]WPC03342.1 ATP-dependent helicase [Pseudomonas benzenivorans]
MLSAVRRYKALVSDVLVRCFPRTTAYLRAERAGALGGPSAKTPVKTRAKAKQGGAGKAKATGARKAAKPRGKPRSKKAPAAGIYGPGRVRVDERQVQAMREKVAQAVAAGLIGPPSDEQWAMILGDRPLIRIFAGAGSGKSTTLVLRVVFMLAHLGIDPARLTVISFTNASCAQLREQLLRLLRFWHYPFDAEAARRCVRTFHSAMATLAREVLGTPVWFEQLDDKRAAAEEPDNPLAASRLRPAQRRLLQQAYQRCYDEEAEFRWRVHALLGQPEPVPAVRGAKAPLDGYRLDGEFTPVPLFEAFYGQAGFMQSIGIELDRMRPETLACAAGERLFVEALLLFWHAFEACLDERGLMTFNGAFLRLTRLFGPGEGAASTTPLTPLSHLLIDEFQDISPQIVQWLRAVHGTLARQGEAVSLMAIGDDWQSIYGWRGSSPELFMDFDRHFPSRGRVQRSQVLLLTTNYRSVEPVIRDAEAVLDAVEVKQAKSSQAFRAVRPGDHGVRLSTGFEIKQHLPKLLEEIEQQCARVASRGTTERTAVLVLSRRNEPLRDIQAGLDSRLPVKAYSIHRAKGLQAEVAIIVDDCVAPQPHPLRNALYAYSGLFRNSYDQAMRDESLRLAYVAITRGVSRVIWFTRRPEGATQLLAARVGRYAALAS